eukprot:scaffold196429_cov19-Tisochrysis_lutea.AAC.1
MPRATLPLEAPAHQHVGVHMPGSMGEQPLKPSKQGRVVQGPWGCGICVPAHECVRSCTRAR